MKWVVLQKFDLESLNIRIDMVVFSKIYEKRFIHFIYCTMVKCSFFIREMRIFDRQDFFDSFIKSEIYRGYSWTHSYKNAHGPFDIQKITPDHYQSHSFSEMEERFRSLLASADYEVFKWPDHYLLETWPDKETEMSYFQALMDELRPNAALCFHLAIPLSAERYWSAAYRDLPVLDFFEEWIVIDRRHQQVHMIHLFRD